MVAFLVEADLVLSDKATKMLRELGAQFEKLDKLAKGIGKNFASEGLGRAAKEMETLSKGARTASESTKMLSESLGRLRVGPGAASGVRDLASQLKSAQASAQALSRTLASLRAPPNMGRGSVPPSGGPPGGGVVPPGAPHGRGRGPVSTAFHAARGAFYAGMDAQMMAQFAGTIFRPSVEFGHQQALARQMGESPADVARMTQAAYRTAHEVPNIGASGALKLERELLPIMYAGARPGEDPVNELIQRLPEAAKMDAILSNTLGEKAGDTGQRMSQYYNAVRAAEIRGLGTQPERMKEFTDLSTKAVIASGGRLDMGQVRQFFAKSGAAGIAMDPNLALRYLPELMIEQGGAPMGTMAATFMKSGVGQMQGWTLPAWEKLGLLDPSKVHMTKGGHPLMDEGAWKNEQQRFNNPFAWMMDTVKGALQAKGIDVDAASRGDQQQSYKLIRQLGTMFSDRNAAKFAELLLLHSQALNRFAQRVDRADPNYERMLRTDPQFALEALKQAGETLLSTSNLVKDHLPLVNALTHGATWLAEMRAEHPSVARAAGMGLGVGGVAAAGYLGFKWLAAGPALTGAAGALTRSAAALTTAAARLGGAGAAGAGAAGTAGAGAAGGAGTTAAAAAAGGRLAMVGRLGTGLGLLTGGLLAYDFLSSIDWDKFDNNGEITKALRAKGLSEQQIGHVELGQAGSNWIRGMFDLPEQATPWLRDALPGRYPGFETETRERGAFARSSAGGADLSGAAGDLKAAAAALSAAAAGKSSVFSPGVGEAAGTTHLPGGGVMVDIPPGSGAEGGVIAGTHAGIGAGTGGAGGGAGPLAVAGGAAEGAAGAALAGVSAALQSAVGALQTAAGAIQATASRPVQLTGTATLTGNVNINMGQLGSQIAALVAKGVAKAASGGGGNSGGARPDTSGGSKAPTPV